VFQRNHLQSNRSRAKSLARLRSSSSHLHHVMSESECESCRETVESAGSRGLPGVVTARMLHINGVFMDDCSTGQGRRARQFVDVQTGPVSTRPIRTLSRASLHSAVAVCVQYDHQVRPIHAGKQRVCAEFFNGSHRCPPTVCGWQAVCVR
jgi:hypothetical protein